MIPPDYAVRGAQGAQRATKVPASTQLAQFALESAWGAKPVGWNLKPPVQTWNFFGMKRGSANVPAITIPTHEVVHGQTVEINAAFRVFASADAAFLAHAMLFTSDSRYSAALAALPDVERFVRLMAQHYATDPAYADKLLTIIREGQLTRFDVLPPPAAAKAA